MNPYSRFGLVSNTVSAATILTALAFAGPFFAAPLEAAITAGGVTMFGTIGAAVGILVIC